MKRNHVQKIDYKTMEYIFDQKPLPSSMKITQVRYEGSGPLMISPDGPPDSDYELVIDASDWAELRTRLRPFAEKEISHRAWNIADTFDNNIHDYYYEHIANTDKDGTWPESYEIARLVEQTQYKTYSTVLVDDRSSPTIALYVRTRAHLRQR